MASDLVLALCANYKFDQIQPFVASLLNECTGVHLHLFSSGFDADFVDGTRALGITMDAAGPYLSFGKEFGVQASSARYFLYRDFLRQYGSEFRKVMLADIRDVFFQGDPFQCVLKNRVITAAEDNLLANCKINRRWIVGSFGEELFNEISNNPISCAGTTIGYPEDMLKYLDLMCKEIAKISGTPGLWEGNDQGIHNYVLWKLRPPFMSLDVDDEIFVTLGHTQAENIAVVDGSLLVNGKLSPVVHQYDRHPQTWHIRQTRRFHLPLSEETDQPSGSDAAPTGIGSFIGNDPGEDGQALVAETTLREQPEATRHPDRPNTDLLDLIPRDARTVLDVGCGTGALGATYRELNNAARLLGIERDPVAAAVARQWMDGVVTADVEIDPLPYSEPQSFDCIVYGDVLQQLSEPWAVVERQMEWLAPGGTVLICIPNVEHWSFVASLFRGNWNYKANGLLDIAHLRWFSLRSVTRAVEHVGLKVQCVRPRVFDPEDAQRFVGAMTQSLRSLDIEPQAYAARALPLQYVLCCTKKAG